MSVLEELGIEERIRRELASKDRGSLGNLYVELRTNRGVSGEAGDFGEEIGSGEESGAETEESTTLEDDYDSDMFEDYEKRLSDAQREWERSLEQLWQALTWIILPLFGRLMGKRMAGYIWRRAMGWWFS